MYNFRFITTELLNDPNHDHDTWPLIKEYNGSIVLLIIVGTVLGSQYFYDTPNEMWRLDLEVELKEYQKLYPPKK